MARHGMAWHDMAWHAAGTVWHGMSIALHCIAWHGMAWHGMGRHGICSFLMGGCASPFMPPPFSCAGRWPALARLLQRAQALGTGQVPLRRVSVALVVRRGMVLLWRQAVHEFCIAYDIDSCPACMCMCSFQASCSAFRCPCHSLLPMPFATLQVLRAGPGCPWSGPFLGCRCGFHHGSSVRAGLQPIMLNQSTWQLQPTN